MAKVISSPEWLGIELNDDQWMFDSLLFHVCWVSGDLPENPVRNQENFSGNPGHRMKTAPIVLGPLDLGWDRSPIQLNFIEVSPPTLSKPT